MQSNISGRYITTNGNCKLFTTNGNLPRKFAALQTYTTFGFVLNQISLSCTGGQCTNAMTMHCGNNYMSSSTISATGSCSLTDDTILAFVTGIWTDDYSINPGSGWIVTDYKNN